MLWEAWQYLTTSAHPIYKKMGYLEEAIAMAARRKRCASAWSKHDQACQQAILQATSLCDQQRTCVILGAGSLQDIPLAALSAQFERVLLVDLIFLKSVKRLIKGRVNLQLLEQDVSFNLELAYQGQKTLADLPGWLNWQEVDCVVSLNILTQLPLIPVRWLMRHFAMTEAEADVYAKQMIAQHLAWLEQCQGVKCLIADREIIEQTAEGKVVDRFDPAWEVALPAVEQQWDWQMIPLGEVSAKYQQSHRVGVSCWI